MRSSRGGGRAGGDCAAATARRRARRARRRTGRSQRSGLDFHGKARPMRTEDEILKLARRLPPARRRRIADKLLESAEREAGRAAGGPDRRLAAPEGFLE